MEFSDLDDGVALHILFFLSTESQRQVRQVCKWWRNLLDAHSSVWTSVRIPPTFRRLEKYPHCAKVGTVLTQLRNVCKHKLRDLCLKECDLTSEDVESLTGFENLICLDLSLCGWVTEDSIDMFGNTFAKLEKLVLAGCHQLSQKGLRSICNLPSLTSLSLDGVLITDTTMAYMCSRLPKLMNLDLCGNGLIGPGMKCLSELQSLENLCLHGLPPSSSGADLYSFLHSTPIKKCEVSMRTVTRNEELFYSAQKSQSLEELCLHRFEITNDHIELLSKSASLRCIKLLSCEADLVTRVTRPGSIVVMDM